MRFRNGVWDRRVVSLLLVPSVQLSVAIQTSENELEKCARKVFPGPSKKPLGMMLVNFFRDDQFIEEHSKLIFRQVLLVDSSIVEGTAHFVSHLRVIGNIGC